MITILTSIFAASTMMASVVYISSRKMGLWQGTLPKEFEEIMSGVDKSKPLTNQEKRNLLS